MADRLGGPVGFDGTVIDAIGHEVEVVPLGLADRSTERRHRQIGQLPHRVDAEALELLRRLGPHSPHRPDRQRTQEPFDPGRGHHLHPESSDHPPPVDVGLGRFRGELGDQFGRCHPDRARQPLGLPDAVPDRAGDLGGVALEPGRASDVEEGLVE